MSESRCTDEKRRSNSSIIAISNVLTQYNISVKTHNSALYNTALCGTLQYIQLLYYTLACSAMQFIIEWKQSITFFFVSSKYLALQPHPQRQEHRTG